jgi:hypothetical protein
MAQNTKGGWVKLFEKLLEKELVGGGQAAEKPELGGDVKIVVLQRGWVAVGRYYKKGNECRLENAYTIGRWGTSKGLPQLANEGPQGETQLHKSDGAIRFHRSGEVFTIDCAEKKWAKYVS